MAFGAFFGGLIAWLVMRAALTHAPNRLVRTNVSGAPVPAVLGYAITSGGAAGLAAVALGSAGGWDAGLPRLTGAASIVLAAMAAAGAWDDGRGDEQPRGFAGHLAAAGGGRLTGGLIKILAAGGAGLAAGLLLHPNDNVMGALTVAAVGLGANLVNLLDRAPGRAGKAALLAGALLALFGNRDWAVAAAGTLAALAVVLPADLRERGMLGDAGANPLGALLGLGLAASLGRPALGVAVAILLLLNLASERWSFSEVIERTQPLRAMDRLGRK